MRSFWAVLAALAAFAAHAAPPASDAGKGAPAISAPARPADSFVALTPYPWATLDPALASDVASYAIIGNVYEPLLAYDGTAHRYKPWLAAEVPTRENRLISNDWKTYRFPIRKGVRFHHGGELTAEDARYSLLREMLIEEKGGSSSLLLQPLFGVDSALDAKGRWAIDPRRIRRAVLIQGNTLVLKLRQPFPGLRSLLASWPVFLSKDWAIAHGDWDGKLPMPGDPPPKASPVLRMAEDGTGPYRLDRADVGGSQTWLSRFDGYWGAPPPLAKVFLKAEPSSEIRAALLRAGEADYAYLERTDLHSLAGAAGVQVDDELPNFSSGEAICFTLALATASNPRAEGLPPGLLQDERVRRALAHAFDGEAYIREALGGKGRRAGGPIAAPLAEHPPDNPFPYDLARAKALLDEARVRDFRLTVGYTRDSARRQIAAEILQRGVQALGPGYRVELEALAPAELQKEFQAHRLPAFILSDAPDYPDAHAVAFQFFHSKGRFAKAQGIADADLDRLEELAAAQYDVGKRFKQFRALEALGTKRAYQIFTAHPTQFRAHAAALKGITGDHSMANLGPANLLYWPSLEKEKAP